MMLSTDLWSRIQEGHCITSIGQCVDGVKVPSLIVGTLPFLCALFFVHLEIHMMLSTDLWSRIQEGHCITSIGQCVDGVTVPSLIVGDSAFSLCTFLCALGNSHDAIH